MTETEKLHEAVKLLKRLRNEMHLAYCTDEPHKGVYFLKRFNRINKVLSRIGAS